MNGKDIFLGLKYVGEDLVEEAEYGSFSNAGKKEKTGTRVLRRKPLLIAALIGLMLFLMGCAWIAIKMQDLKIGQITEEQYVFAEDDSIVGTETVSRTVLTLAGLKGSAAYKANAEWYAFREGLLASISQMEQEGTLPEDYWQNNTYWVELNAKADRLAKEYDLKPQGQKLEFRTTRNMCDALGIERFQTDSDAVAVTVKDGSCYDNGNFLLNMDFSFPDGQGYDIPDTWGILYWNWKDCFSPDYVLLKDSGDWREWNYTTASGTNVLILRSESDWNGYIICDREDALMTLRVEARKDLGYNVDGQTWFEYLFLTDRQMEQLADAIDFGINPKVVSQADVEQQAAISTSQTQNGFTLHLKSVETDGWYARIVVGVAAPEGMDIESMDIGTGSPGDELKPLFGQAYGSAAFNDVPDGDGLTNTKDLVMEANLSMVDDSKPFATGSVWELRIVDLWENPYRDGERILTEGEWTFSIVFEESAGEGVTLEFAEEPLTVSAVVGWMPDGTNVFDAVRVTSFALHSGSAVIRHEEPSALEFSTFDAPMYVVMNDGSRIKLQENSGSAGITRYTLEESIDLSRVAHILLMDGTILKIPQ
ncbi:MAG: hypothetical protein IJA75_09730 [Oscillospiraceae bacterium]|nr:hypothetical protein [Oscillospiraceae bacterium]